MLIKLNNLNYKGHISSDYIISSMTPEDWVVLDDGHDPIVKSKFQSLHSSHIYMIPPKSTYSKKYETKKNTIKHPNHSLCTSKPEQLKKPNMAIFGTTETQIRFSYSKQIDQELSRHSSKNGHSFVKDDIQLMYGKIISNSSLQQIVLKAQSFKRESVYFNFKSDLSRILFHILLTQVALTQSSIHKALQQLHFCEYHSRKLNLHELTICFLWHISTIQMTLSEYQLAIKSVKNLIEMAVVSKKHKYINYGLEKISLIYYYQGNSHMGEYYLQKIENGFDDFQIQIYQREYSHEDQLHRLEQILFGETSNMVRGNGFQSKYSDKEKLIGKHSRFYSSNSLFPNLSDAYLKKRKKNVESEDNSKRKFNIKYEVDAYRRNQSKLIQKNLQFHDEAAEMLKDSQWSKIGSRILSNIHENIMIGHLKMGRKANFKNDQKSGFANPVKADFRKSEQGEEKMFKNQTRVLKSHLSKNRDNICLNSEVRWKQFMEFLQFLRKKHCCLSGACCAERKAHKIV